MNQTPRFRGDFGPFWSIYLLGSTKIDAESRYAHLLYPSEYGNNSMIYKTKKDVCNEVPFSYVEQMCSNARLQFIDHGLHLVLRNNMTLSSRLSNPHKT